MKICFLAAGSSIHSKKWIEYFAQKGHDVFWISVAPFTEGEVKGVKTYCLKGNFFSNSIHARQLIKKIQPDIVHAHYAGINGFMAAFSGFHPFILTAWGSDVLITAKNKIKAVFIKFALDKADLITCDAEHLKNAMIKMGVLEAKIRIICFGIDTQKFRPRNKELLKEKVGVSNCSTVISLRNFDPVYDIETLIKAVLLILKEIPRTRFLIGGRGPEEKKLKNLAKSLNVSKAVEFMGFVANDKMADYLGAADVYVSTSLSDAGISASTAEAMACATPVVITDTGENEKWIKDGESGYLIPVKDPEVLAQKIVYLLKDRNLRERFGLAGRKIIQERNDYYREMAKMENIYQELIKKTNNV